MDRPERHHLRCLRAKKGKKHHPVGTATKGCGVIGFCKPNSSLLVHQHQRHRFYRHIPPRENASYRQNPPPPPIQSPPPLETIVQHGLLRCVSARGRTRPGRPCTSENNAEAWRARRIPNARQGSARCNPPCFRLHYRKTS